MYIYMKAAPVLGLLNLHHRYRGRGLFLDPPTVALVQGAWQVHAPAGVLGATAVTQAMDSRDALFAYEARCAPLVMFPYFQHLACTNIHL